MSHPVRLTLRSFSMRVATAGLFCGVATLAQSQTPTLDSAGMAAVDQGVATVAPRMVEWRRDIHAHPELSGQEQRTARLVADHLTKLGMEVQTGVGGHGVIGLLKGGSPGKTVALRADMDALPVAEVTGLPFASQARQTNMGKDSPVMHACGHDGHTAILMGVAETLAGMKAQLPGKVKFVFQPAEEGISQPLKDPKQSFGAKAMAEQGAMDGVDVIYGLHITPQMPVGTIGYRSGPLLSAGDTVNIKVTGKQTHGAMPWNGVDTVVVAAQIVTALQTIVSRQLNIANEPAVLTIGSIHGGNRENIVPETVELLGTLRTFDEGMRTEAKKRITNTAQGIAQASDAKAEVSFGPSAYPVTANPPGVVEAALPVLKLATGGKAIVIPKVSASEDFSEFQHKVPGMFFMLGALPEGQKAGTAAPNHSPAFQFNENAMPVGARTLVALTLDYLARNK